MKQKRGRPKMPSGKLATPVLRICKRCGKEFLATKSTQKFCSGKTEYIHKRPPRLPKLPKSVRIPKPKIQKLPKQPKLKLPKIPKQSILGICKTCGKEFVTKSGQKYCHNPCEPIVKVKPKKPETLRICKNPDCKKEFWSSRRQFFCSYGCREKFHGLNNLKIKKPKIEVSCLWCQQKFFQKTPENLWCDYDCRQAFHSKEAEIMREFQYEKERGLAELAKLKAQGKFYVLPIMEN